MNQELVCNICGKPFDIFDRQQNFRIHNDHIGYGSYHDGEGVDLRMCCSCFDKLMAGLNFTVDPFFLAEDEEPSEGSTDYEQTTIQGYTFQ